MTSIYVLEEVRGVAMSDRVFRKLEITDREAEEWVEKDYRRRIAEASPSGKPLIKKRSCQEIMDEMNREFRNECIRKLRHTETDIYYTDRNGEKRNLLDIVPDNSLSPVEYIEQTESQEKVEAFLSLLTPIQRKRVRMLMDGMSVTEIAKAEGCNYTKVKKTIDQVRKKYKKFFQ